MAVNLDGALFDAAFITELQNIGFFDKNISVDWSQSIMEEIISRFPHIGEDIFKELNSKDFCKSKKICRSWNDFITNQRVLQRDNKNRIEYKIQTWIPLWMLPFL